MKTKAGTEDTRNVQAGLQSNVKTKPICSGLRLLVRIVFTTGCILILSYQITKMYNLYTKYPTGVKILVDEPGSMEDALPGITICNRNKIQLSKLIKKWPDLKTKIDNYTYEDDKFYLIEEHIEKHLSEDETTVKTFYNFGPNMDDFLKYVKCDSRRWNLDKNHCEEKFRVIPSYHYNGFCFTLFHEAVRQEFKGKDFGIERKQKLRRSKNHADNFVISDGQTSDDSDTHQFLPNEIIQIMVDFQPNESTKYFQPPGGMIYISDIRDIPDPTNIPIKLEPGHMYEIYVKRETTKQLPEPYDTNCTDYYNLNKNLLEKLKTYRTVPISRMGCYQSCFLNSSFNTCNNYWPPEMPFFPGVNYGLDVVWGLWAREIKPTLKTKKLCVEFSSKNCKQKCKTDCKQDNYETIVQKRSWPSPDVTRYAENELLAEFDRLRNCCALISIRYSTFLRTIRDYEPRYHLLEFVSYIGGLISMWIGFNFLHMWAILEFLRQRNWTPKTIQSKF